jgi:hypothetical protein
MTSIFFHCGANAVPNKEEETQPIDITGYNKENPREGKLGKMVFFDT